MEHIILNNKLECPAVGIGTFMLSPADAENSVREALKMGYRLIDTANAYVNERAVGRGMKDSGVKREDIFLSTKLWPSEYENENAVDETLERLGVDYVDLLYIHQPAGNWLAGYRQLEAGIAALFQSKTYKAYLSTMSKFHNYSLNNTLLIALQKPDATLVAGYQAWQKQHQRHVRKGEKGIQIIAPSPYKEKKEREVLDPATGRPKLDAQGKPMTEIVEVEYPGFRVATVFDVSQTEGKELPSLGVDELSGKVDGYSRLLTTLTEICPVPIGFEQIGSGAKGYYHTTEQRIALQQGMSELQTVKTLIHEMAHHKLHSHEKEKPRAERLTTRSKEVEAESVAYTVCQHFGIDTSDYSFGYIAGWSSGKETAELKESLGKIRDAASEMITDIEAKLAEMEKAPELAAIPETVSGMGAPQPDRASASKVRQTAGKEAEKSSVLQELTAKKADPKKPDHGRKKPARTEETR